MLLDLYFKNKISKFHLFCPGEYEVSIHQEDKQKIMNVKRIFWSNALDDDDYDDYDDDAFARKIHHYFNKTICKNTIGNW